jgi:outer membrane receptor protein involved in Fe transport
MLRAEYDLTDTWTGYSYYSAAEQKVNVNRETPHLGRMQLAFAGQGGATGDQYWNPFGTADSRAPGYIQGVTDNPPGLIDWINQSSTGDRSRDFLDIFETAATGDIFELPAGTVRMAAGFQWRDVEERDFAGPLSAIGHNYNVSVISTFDADTRFFSEAKAVFVEFEVPVLETVDLQLAARHEEFTTFGLAATTPKIAVRWEALPTLALRASWGESFLAPTPTQSRPFIRDENCAEIYSGTDKFLDVPMTGGTRCESGNPSLAPETSEIRNIGFTWQPTGDLDGLEISVDYQEIEYEDRIRTLTEQDTVAFTFQNFLNSAGITEDSYDATPGSSSRAAATAWFAANPDSGGSVVRLPDESVDRVFRQSQNISSVFIDLVDTKVSYSMGTDNWGTFNATLSTSFFLTYEYQGQFGGIVDALGNQNGGTGIVPPIPEFKSNLRINWFMDNQSASISANHWDDVKFDGRVYDNYSDGWIAPNTIEAETRVNAQYAIVLEDYFNSEFTVSAGITNLFDRRPQRLPILGGFESRLSTPWGRQFWMSIDWTPGG